MRGRWIFSSRIVPFSAAVLSAAVALRPPSPAAAAFLAAGALRIYRSVGSWLTPPYLYFVINGIIISIAATSRYQKKTVVDAPSFSEEAFDARIGGEEMMSSSEKEESVIWSSGGDGLVRDKPLVSARLGRRRSIKASPEGKALGVARSRKNETLESTWRTLTEGRAVPLARHLKKSDTWATHARATAGDPTSPPASREVQKFETFNARSSAGGGGYSSPAAKLRREPSLGQDDLNRRVEAFIKRFNEEMRLQRQESLQKFKDMINRGSL